MINTPLFECLERLMRICNVLDQVNNLVDGLDYAAHSKLKMHLRKALLRERNFLEINITEWLKDDE